MRRVIALLMVVGLLLQNSVQAGSEAMSAAGEGKQLAYLVSDIRIPFWEIMARGVTFTATQLGYQVETLSADNLARRELENTVEAIKARVSGIILSPTNSSASVTILGLAERAGIPVVIADIGTDSGNYVSYISSNNREGGYRIGKVLAARMHELGWQQGKVGIVAIPQMRANGQARTAGFMQAMREAGIKGAGIRQQVTFSHEETYRFSKELIARNPDLRALWLQGSDRYRAALEAIADAGKTGEILLICFDAEPEFLQLIPEGVIVGAAMQQPYLMGEEAVRAMDRHLHGADVEKKIELEVLAISGTNIEEKMPAIRRNVLGMDSVQPD